MPVMKAIAPGTVVFHRHRGYGVLTSVNLLTGWVTARFGDEKQGIDLNLSTDAVQYADGEPILFRKQAPDRTPHARLMAMMLRLHHAGYQRLYLYSWPRESRLHWNWHLFTGNRTWHQRGWRKGWYGSGYDYIFNPVMGWGDAPGADTEALIRTLSRFDPEGLASAYGEDEEHTLWFRRVCKALLPGYMYSLEKRRNPDGSFSDVLPVYPVNGNVPEYDGPSLPCPPGWNKKYYTEPVTRNYFSIL